MFPSEFWEPTLHARSDPQERKEFVVGPGINELGQLLVALISLDLEVHWDSVVLVLVVFIFVRRERVQESVGLEWELMRVIGIKIGREGGIGGARSMKRER